MRQYVVGLVGLVILMSGCQKIEPQKEPPPPTPIQKTLDTITSLDQIREGDSAVLKISDTEFYEVESRQVELEDDTRRPTSGMPADAVVAKVKNPPCDSEGFDGKDRRIVKTSIAVAPVEKFMTTADMMGSPNWPSDAAMGSTHKPAIRTGEKSVRVTEEKRNVRIASAWIYTFKREGDEDYHVIIGDSPDITKARFFNVEISGLPALTSKDYQALKKVRDQFLNHFHIGQKCLKGYALDFKKKPVPIELEGSLFFDKTHFDGGGPIGPAFARATTYWEIHPVTAIKFK